MRKSHFKNIAYLKSRNERKSAPKEGVEEVVEESQNEE
jgi:hypothetical protein